MQALSAVINSVQILWFLFRGRFMRSATRRCRTSRPSPAGERQCICSRVARPVGLQRKGSRRPSRHRRMARPTLGGGATCESCPSIDVREWHRQGRLQSGQQFSWSWTCGGESAGSISERVESAAVVLRYRSCSSGSSECKAIEQRVPISLTTCHLGGVRPWFLCPVYCDSRYCGRRAAILYCAGDLFACRRCYRLLYASQQQTPLHRALEQARKIRTRLGGSADLLEPFPAKPKGMHRRTFQRLRARAEASMYEVQSFGPKSASVSFNTTRPRTN
jgi:hypothetical protein